MDMSLFMESYTICPGNKCISQLFLLITIECRMVELSCRSVARALPFNVGFDMLVLVCESPDTH